MNELFLMVTIMDRNKTKRFKALYESCGINVAFDVIGYGTAASEILAVVIAQDRRPRDAKFFHDRRQTVDLEIVVGAPRKVTGNDDEVGVGIADGIFDQRIGFFALFVQAVVLEVDIGQLANTERAVFIQRKMFHSFLLLFYFSNSSAR